MANGDKQELLDILTDAQAMGLTCVALLAEAVQGKTGVERVRVKILGQTCQIESSLNPYQVRIYPLH